MIRITEQYVWQVVFGLFFCLLAVMGIIILSTEARLPLTALAPTDLILITLATWRLTRLFINDSITKFFREQFFDLEAAGRGYTLVKPKRGPRRILNELLTCPWCLGVWMSAIVTFFYLLTEMALYPVIFLAVASVASFLHLISQSVGLHTERLKNDSERE